MKMECPKSESVDDETTPTRRRSRNRKFIKLTSPEPDMFEAKTSSEDTCLKVDGKYLYASSSILSLASPTFKSQIEENVSRNASLEIELEGKRYKDVLEFLKCIYPSIMQRLSMKNIPVVLPLAFEYEVKPLIRNCEAVILEELIKARDDGNSDPDDICLYLAKAFEYNLPDLQKICLELAVDSYDILPKQKVKSLPVQAKAELQGRVIESMNEEIETKDKEIHAKNKIIEARNKDIEAKTKENMSLTMFADLKTRFHLDAELASAMFQKFLDKRQEAAVYIGARGLKVLMDRLSTVNRPPVFPWNPRVCYLEYSFSVQVNVEKQLSPPITVHGINWCIDVRINETTLEVYLEAMMPKACTCSQAWTCQVYAQVSLHNFKYVHKTIQKTLLWNQTFKASSNGWGCRDVAKMKEVLDKDGGYIKDGKARVEIYMYAAEPVFE